MYLTRLTLDVRSRTVRRDLGSAYEMHRTLARAFAPDEASSPERFLWRLETGSAWRQRPVVLVQSALPGRWAALSDVSGYLSCPPEEKAVELADLVQDGRRMRFRLLANPTVTRNGKRYGLAGEQEQLAWLSRQGERHGFHMEAAVVTAQDLMNSRKEGRPLIIQRVLYDGYLEVADSGLLSRALMAGIGPAKAFGCGLLSVARA